MTTAAMTTATVVPVIESTNWLLGREPAPNRATSDAVLHTMINTLVQTVRVQPIPFFASSKPPQERLTNPRIAWTIPRPLPVASTDKLTIAAPPSAQTPPAF